MSSNAFNSNGSDADPQEMSLNFTPPSGVTSTPDGQYNVIKGVGQDANGDKFNAPAQAQSYRGARDFQPSSLMHPCPVCAKTDGDCRVMAKSDLVQCLTYQEPLSGWRYTGLTSNGLWGKYYPLRDHRPVYGFQQKREPEAPKPEWTPEQWHGHYEAIRAKLPTLDPADQADLEKRLTEAGLDPAIHIPVLAPISRSRGYLIPIPTHEGFRVKGQIRLRGEVEGGRYRWDLPNEGIDGRINGEQPLAVWGVESDVVVLAEGTGVKPYVAGQLLQARAIGAAGGMWFSSPKALKAAIGSATVARIAVDAGAISNRLIVEQYRRVKDLLQDWGLTVEFGWWGQEAKTDRDIDEGIKPSEIQWLSPQDFYKLTKAEPITATPALKELARIEERVKVTIAPADAVTWFEEGALAETIADCKSKGYRYILNSSVTGSGKSNSAGLLTPEELGASRIWYVNPDHRNPTTQTLIDGWVDLPARHGGLSREIGPDGQPQLRRTKPGGTADIWRNCEQIDTLDQLRAKNVAGADTAGTICKGCPSFAICSTPQDPVTYRGPDYLFYRRAAMASPRLRAHPDSLPHAGNHDYQREILIFDDCQPKTSRTLDITLADIVATEIECRDRGLTDPALMALLRSLRELLKGEFPRYGIGHDEVLAALPDVSGIDAVAIDAALAPDLSFLEPDEVEGRVKGKGNLNHLLKEEQLRQNLQTAQNLPKVWLGDFIRVLQGGTGETVRATSAGLTLTLRDNTHRDICKSAHITVFADATNSVQNLAKQLGVDPSEVIEIRQRMPEGATLNCIQIFDLGRVTRDRGEDQKRRVAALQAALDKEGKLGVIDFKAFEGADRFGAWFRDSRGSNAFQDCDNILAIGTPCQNLGSLLAEYCLLEGRNVAMDDTGFQDWVTWKILVEIEQAKGRLRASRRAGEVLNFYLVSDLQSDQGGIDGFEQVTAKSLTVDAGSKPERTYSLIVNAAVAKLKAGQKVTQAALAKIVGVSQGRISQLVKAFQGSWDQFLELLIPLLKLHSEINNPAPPVPEDEAATVRDMVTLTPNDQIWSMFVSIYHQFGAEMVAWILAKTPLDERERWASAIVMG